MNASFPAWIRHPLPWILLLAALLRIQTSGYLRSSDDLVYAQAAQDLLEGRYDPSTGGFHKLRFGVILPTAASFAMFGVHPRAAVVWPMFASLASLAVLYFWVSQRSSRTTGAWASLFMAVATQHCLSGAELFPDSALLLWSLLALWLYVEEREHPGRRWRYAAAGAALYLGFATRIETVKLLPLLAILEAWYGKRRGFDRGTLALPGTLLGLLVLDSAVLAAFPGGASSRLRELFPAVEGWAASSAARGLGAWVMIKSLFSPWGAFGLLTPAAAIGGIWIMRRKGDALPLILGGYILLTTLVVAERYKIADGRHFTLLTPFIAWPAAQLLGAEGRARRSAAATLALVCILLFHTRLMPDTAGAYTQLEETVRSAPGPLYSDTRTVNVLKLYFPKVDARDYSRTTCRPPGWLADNELLRGIDLKLYGRDPFPGPSGIRVATIPVRVRGLPGLRWFVEKLLPHRVSHGGLVSEIHLYRL